MCSKNLIFENISIDATSHTVEANDVQVHLTTSEFAILYLLANSPRVILSPQEIYNRIWNMEDLGNIATVRVHITRLRRKLREVCIERELILTSWKKGYQFVPEGEKHDRL